MGRCGSRLLWEFWEAVEKAEVNCGGEVINASECFENIASSVVSRLVSIGFSGVFFEQLAVPVSSIRSLEDMRHHWLSSEFSHVAYMHPNKKGYQHFMYLNHPTTPSKIRFNIANSGTHSSKLMLRDTEDLSRSPKRQQATNQELWVDFSRDDEMPPLFNDFNQLYSLEFGKTLSSQMFNYLATNHLNGSCFLVQYPGSTGIRSAILKVMPSSGPNGENGNFPKLDCGNDLQAYNISIPL